MEVKKRDVLFLCQYSYPEVNSSATLPFDTAVSLAQQGYQVDVMCGWPKEYSLETSVPKHEMVSGVSIHRLRYFQSSRVGKCGRLLNFFTFTAAVLLRLPFLRHYRCVMVYSNPPVLPLVCVLANALFHTKFIFVVYDVYPEIAFASGALRQGGLISRVMNRINKKVFRRAAQVIALTDEMKRFLLKHRPELSPERVSVISNWAHEGAVKPEAETRRRLNCSEETLLVSYFGNLGVCQDMETVMDAMELLAPDEQIRLVIAGHGSKLPAVQTRAETLANVQILPFLTGDVFEKVAAVCDCGIVSLERGLQGTCAPSKYYSYLQSGQPVLAVADSDSYLAEEIRAERIGFSVSQGDGNALAECLRALKRDRSALKEKGARARALYLRRYDQPIAMEAYAKIIASIMEEEGR